MPRDLQQPMLPELAGHEAAYPSSLSKPMETEKGKVKDTPIPKRNMRIMPDTGQRWNWSNIESLAGQSITNMEEGASYLELNYLSPAGGASTVKDIVGVLFQISMLPSLKVNKLGTDAIHAMAFILAEADLGKRADTISEAVAARVETHLETCKAGLEDATSAT